jgi:hypothetical protein
MTLDTLDFELTFTADEVEFSAAGKPADREYAGRHNSGRTGSWTHVRVAPSGGSAWVATFQLNGAACALFGMPSGDELLVVGGGESYVISARNPDHWYQPPVWPVCGVRRVVGHPIVLLWDFQNLAACGPRGVLWETERLGDDEVVVEHDDAQGIVGSAWRGGAPGTGHVTFLIEPTTGTVVKTAP